MVPLKTNQKVLRWLSLLPAESDSTELEMLICKLTTLLTISFELLGMLSSIFFILQFSNDLEVAIYALFQANAAVAVLYILTVSFLSRNKFKIIFDDLTDIYSKRKNLSIT